ncbi:hypothetical protein F503_04331 [Ophiostoma piceae UAMH 11346]|uniref:Involucrin repeat protein n=1 Tax=Ophiostoma piceae (strain UAMH 11346) TaxID=1262450 RepID=S3C5H7_OPHP1|nr:hypothetical protein F503_04331 [Ophiostoma piceae UAMH 11346]
MLNTPSAPATASSSASSISSLASSSVISSTSDAQGGGAKTGAGTAVGAGIPQQASPSSGSSATASPGTTSASASQAPSLPPATVASSAATSNRNSSKRKGGPATGAVSTSHVLRTTSTASAVAASSSSGSLAGGSGAFDIRVDAHKSVSSGPPSPRSINSVHSGASSIMIAPPPRVALGAGNQSTVTVPEPNSSASGGSGGSSSNTASGPLIGSGSSSGGSTGGGPTSSSTGSGSKEAQPHHFVYTANHHNHHQRHLGHHAGHHNHHHSISSVSSVTSSSVIAAAAASLNASAASAQLVREKDMRIALLERELKIMESEFTRELDRLSKAESETATFWQAKHNRLQQQIAHSDTAFQLLRAEVELREAERTELRAGWEDMQRAALDREEEMRALRNQVRGLKEWVSTSTRTDGQVASDEVFGDGMARLANGLQNWVIVHFRRAKLDLEKAGKAARDELATLVPMYKELVHSSKLQLLQSAVSRIFVDLVFESYYVGLSSDQASQLVGVESFLKQFAGATEPLNQWRSLTLAIISKDADQQLREHTALLTDSVVARVNNLLDTITAEGTTQRSDARDQALRQLVTNAIELARLLVGQKAMFRVFMPSVMPHQQVFFDAATMDDIGGEEDDEDGLSQREISCVTFPGIIKRGDETGSQLQYTNVICKARVLCAAE